MQTDDNGDKAKRAIKSLSTLQSSSLVTALDRWDTMHYHEPGNYDYYMAFIMIVPVFQGKTHYKN